MKTAPDRYSWVVVNRGYYSGSISYVTEVYPAHRSCMLRFTRFWTDSDGNKHASYSHRDRAWSGFRPATAEEIEAHDLILGEYQKR